MVSEDTERENFPEFPFNFKIIKMELQFSEVIKKRKWTIKEELSRNFFG